MVGESPWVLVRFVGPSTDAIDAALRTVMSRAGTQARRSDVVAHFVTGQRTPPSARLHADYCVYGHDMTEEQLRSALAPYESDTEVDGDVIAADPGDGPVLPPGVWFGLLPTAS